MDPLLAGTLLTPIFFVLGMAVYRFYYVAFEARGSDAGLRGLAFFFGLAFIVEVALILTFGVDQRMVEAGYIGDSVSLGIVRLPTRMLVAFGVAMLLTIVLSLYLSFTFTGRAVKAVAQDETALALMGLKPEGALVSGSIRFEGRELVGLAEEAMRQLRGDRIAMIFQEPMTALNPLHKVGAQVAEPLMLHRELSKREAEARAVQLLEHMRLAEPERAARSYPLQLSGGERQRAMIAMAIGCSPRLILADETTTALDVTVTARIIALIDGLKSNRRWRSCWSATTR
jgi:ABC-type ATPase involved in cell division